MLTNATLIRIDLPGTPDVSGAVAFVTGDAISFDVLVDEVKRSQQIALGGRIAEASSVIYVEMADLADAPASRSRLAYVVPVESGGDGTTVTVREVVDTTSKFNRGGLGCHACFVKVVAE